MKNIHDIFFEMEFRKNLFSLELEEGLYYWDLIRRDVFAKINLNSNEEPKLGNQNQAVSHFIHSLKNLAKSNLNIISKNYILRRQPDFIFSTFSRSKNHDVNYDFIVDPLIETINSKSVAIEYSDKSSINLFNLLLGKKTKVYPVKVPSMKLIQHSENIDKKISAAVKEYFHKEYNFQSLISNSLSTFTTNYNYYVDLFSIHKPKAIISTDDGSFKGIYKAARESNIPVLEIQHGASPGSILWNYDQRINHKKYCYLPSHFLTFSDYWSKNLNFPVKNQFSIGNDSLYSTEIRGKTGVVFVSNNKLNKEFTEYAKNLELLNPDLTIYFKLHPQDFSLETEISKQFSRTKIILLTDQMSTEKIFENCQHIVAQRSSFIYSALQAGKTIHIFKKYNYDWDKELIKKSKLFLTSKNLDQNIKKVNSLSSFEKDQTIYFEKFDQKKLLNIIKNL